MVTWALEPADFQGEADDIRIRIVVGGRLEHFETKRVRKDGAQVESHPLFHRLHPEDAGRIRAAILAQGVPSLRLGGRGVPVRHD